MLYSIFKILFRITFKVFFRKTYRDHPERLSKEGPLLICANHSGALLDPIVLAALLERRVHFLAKGAVFQGKLAQWFLPKLNMIPIYRQQDDPSLMNKNKETFARCYDHLGRGGAIIIFPEGISITGRKLNPLKTGAARIALGAEEKYGFNLGVHISCIGINYEDPHTFRRDVFIGFSEPIRVSDYAAGYREKGFAAAEELTEEIRHRLEAEMIHTADAETDRLVSSIERLYKEELLRERGIDDDDKPADFEMTKRIVRTVEYFREHDPQRVAQISQEIKSYFWKLDELGLSDRVVRGGSARQRLWLRSLGDLLLIVLGFPVYVYGLIHNYLPFITASLIVKYKVKSPDFRGAIGAVSGMFLFLVWYIALGLISWHYFHAWGVTSRPGWAFLLYFMTWPASGLLAWFYFRSVTFISKRWLMISLFFRRAALIAELIMQRNQIIGQFEKAVKDRGEVY